jgi:hypothetical protein
MGYGQMDDMSETNPNTVGERMRLRKLRIAWSLMFAIATVLVISLWVRSYWVQDRLFCPAGSKDVVEVDSAAGVVWVQESDALSMMKLNQHFYQFKLDDKYLPFVHSLRQKAFMGFARFEENLGMGITGRTTIVPHWFLVVVSAGLVYVPWLPWSNRFGLRTLLLATTLAAVVLGAIVYTVK